MQAWNQWGSQPAPGYQSYQPPPGAAPPAAPAGAQPAYPLGYQYYGATPGLAAAAAATPDMTGYSQQQWNVVHQQHWQQWQQWQQQFQQWQQQYGDKYQESLNSMTAQSSTPAAAAATATTAAPAVPPPPDMAHPPPLPPPDKTIPPPPPAEESESQLQQTQQPPDPFRPPSTVTKLPEPPPATTTQPDFTNRASGTNFPTDRPNPPMPYYGVPPPSKGTPLPTEDFNKPPPPPPPSNYDVFGNRGNAGDNFQSSKRPFEGDTFRDQFPGGDDAKKPRSDNFGSGYQGYKRGEDQGTRGRGRGGRWSAPHPIDEPERNNKQSEGDTAPQPVRPPAKDNPDELSEAEKAFDVQFKQWEEQFNKWKEQNINHPDKTQYREYEAKWESWREQLLQRREQMRKKREASQKLSGTSDSNAESSFQSAENSGGRGATARGRGGRGRGNFGRGGGSSNMGQDDYRDRGFGSAQEQSFGGGFREQKPAGAVDFGGYGMSQDPASAPPRPGGHDNFGFGLGQESKKQEPKIPCNRGPADFIGPQQAPPPLGGFGVPPPPLGQLEPKQNRSPGDFGGSPKTQQKPPSLLSPSHSNQFTPVPKLSGEEKKSSPEAEKPEDQKEEKTDALDFMKKSNEGIPGLDLLAGDEKTKDSEKAAAEERELSIGHDTDERAGDKSNQSSASVGSNPKEPSSKPAPVFGKVPFQPIFGPEPQNTPGFPPANQNAPNFSPANQGPKSLFSQAPPFGPDMNKGPGNEGPSFGPGNQGPFGGQDSQGFGPQSNMGQRGFEGFGPNNQGPFQGPSGFNFGPPNNQGFGPGPRQWGDGMDGPNRNNWNQGPPRFDGPGKDSAPGMRENFQGPRDSFQGMRDNFQGPRDGSQGQCDNFQGPRDSFFGNRDNFQGPRDGGFGNTRDNLQGPRDNFQGPRDNFQGPGPRDGFAQGPRDSFSGPGDRFLGPRDNFQGPKDRFAGPPFGDFNFQGRDFAGESEFGRGGPHDFPPPRDFQEGGRGVPQDFGSEFGRGRMGRGRGRGRGGSFERGPADDMNWQRGGGRFGPGPDEQRIQPPDAAGQMPQL